MRILKSVVVAAIIALLFSTSGCLPRYGIANGGGEPIHFTKPVYRDTAVSATYVGGKYSHTMDSAYSNRNESSYFGELYLYRSHTREYYNFSYGAFGYTGKYKVAVIEQYRGSKGFYGGGVSSEFNLSIPTQFVDLRLVGIRGTLLYETGDFYSFRKRASKEGLIDNCSYGRMAYNISLSSELAFKIKNESFGVYGSLGSTENFSDYHSIFTITCSGYYTHKRITAYIQMTDCYDGIGEVYSLGLNFKIK